jgi:hypothetical protein
MDQKCSGQEVPILLPVIVTCCMAGSSHLWVSHSDLGLKKLTSIHPILVPIPGHMWLTARPSPKPLPPHSPPGL